MNEHEHDELFWTAAQYAAGDLPAEAAGEFEQRLENDQSAREVLAQAVALSEAVAQAEAPADTGRVLRAAPAARSRTAAIVAWTAVVTAACVALTFVYYSRTQSVGQRAGGPVAQTSVSEAEQQLAFAWAERHAEESLAAVEPLPFDADEDVDFELPTLNVEPSAPDWLIAALVDAENPPTRSEN